MLLSLVAGLVSCVAVRAQPPARHYLHHQYLPPGAIGQQQLMRHPSIPGYYQAVEVLAPPGATVTFLDPGSVPEPQPAPVLAGMQVGFVYSFKLSGLPNREGVELFPTVEIINRLYPPEGAKTRFPIPIEISEDDISQALGGLFVTRVVYMEDPEQALPRADPPKTQREIDVAPHEDPLHVADRLGRPMAIIRIGSRVPLESDGAYALGAAPPVLLYPRPPQVAAPQDVEKAIERQAQPIPRL